MTVSNIPRRAVLVRLQTPADHARQVHFYCALAGETPEDFGRPGFFDSLAPKLRRFDRIEVTRDEADLFVEYMVVESSNLGVKVLFMRGGAFGDTTQAGAPGAAIRRTDDMRVENRGPFLLWCVVRGDRVLRDKFATESDAIRHMNELARTTARGPEAA